MKLDSVRALASGDPYFFSPCAQCGNALLAPDWSEHVSPSHSSAISSRRHRAADQERWAELRCPFSRK
jgi:hypothetical protein